MVSGNPSDAGNLPSPFKQPDGRHLINLESEAPHAQPSTAASFVSSSCVSLSGPHVGNVYGTLQSYTADHVICNSGTDSMRLGTLQNPQFDGGGLRIQGVCDTGFVNPQVNINFFSSETHTPGDYETNETERVAEGHNINWSPILSTISKSTTNIVTSNDINRDGFHPGNTDGSFLTLGLGLGGDAEHTEKTTFSSREIPGTPSAQISSLFAQQTTANFSNLGQESSGGFLGFQLTPAALQSHVVNSGGWTSSLNNNRNRAADGNSFGLMQSQHPFHGHGVMQSQNPFHGSGLMQSPYPFHGCGQSPYPFHGRGMMQSPFPFPLHGPVPTASEHYSLLGSAGYLANSPGINPTMDASAGYQRFVGPDSLPFNSFNTQYPHSGFTRNYELMPESAKSVWTSLPPPLPQNLERRKDNDDPSSSILSHSTNQGGSSVTHDYLGLLTPPREGLISHAVESTPSSLIVPSVGPISSTLEIHPTQGLRNSTSEKYGLQITQSYATGPVRAGPLPVRPVGVHARNKVIQDQTYKHLENAGPFVGPRPYSGPQDTSLLPPNVGRPLSTGPGLSNFEVHRPPQTSYFGRPPSTGPGLSSFEVHRPPQTSYVSRGPLKRKAAEPPQLPPWGLRRKYVHVPQHSTTSMTQGAATTLPPPVTSAVAHIKRTGSVKTPKLAGWKCLLCKKDLSFSADNPMHQPTVPPAVAVLPCGHTFHDECLQSITPEDQAKDPPCIPCALGEE